MIAKEESPRLHGHHRFQQTANVAWYTDFFLLVCAFGKEFRGKIIHRISSVNSKCFNTNSRINPTANNYNACCKSKLGPDWIKSGSDHEMMDH